MLRNLSSNSRVITLSLRLALCLFGLSLMLAHPPATWAAELTVTNTALGGPDTDVAGYNFWLGKLNEFWWQLHQRRNGQSLPQRRRVPQEVRAVTKC